jgi:hypothetical protein
MRLSPVVERTRLCACGIPGIVRDMGMFLLAQVLVVLFCLPAFAAHPLITDDAATQGEGKFQIEVNGEYFHDDHSWATEDGFEIETIVSYGVLDNMDLVVGVPYLHVRTKERGSRSSQAGVSDVSVELKWRFFEESGWSLALKPGITIPTGDRDKGLGSGRVSPSLFLITTKEIEAWAFHLNLGYLRNENAVGEKEDLWHASMASEWELVKGLRAVANVGVERASERDSATPAAFILGGLIYSLRENLDVDVGVKKGLTKSEGDYSILAGIAWRF